MILTPKMYNIRCEIVQLEALPEPPLAQIADLKRRFKRPARMQELGLKLVVNPVQVSSSYTPRSLRLVYKAS